MISWNNIELPNNPYYQDEDVVIYHADCRDILPSLQGVSAVVTDCPYELGFMGKSWDSKGVSFQVDTWRLIREVCLPGAMLLSFGGTRTSHRIACAIEDAGWQIRDTIMWVYGSGFPKSLSIGKQIDKKAGAKREIIGKNPNVPQRHNTGTERYGWNKEGDNYNDNSISAPATPEAKLWEGYGTALKPAYEPIIVAMKPLDGTFANNALKHKVAGLNIDQCRISSEEQLGREQKSTHKFAMLQGGYKDGFRDNTKGLGRFPSNFIHDGSQEVMELFPDSKSSGVYKKQGKQQNTGRGKIRTWDVSYDKLNAYGGDSGSAARFFYTAKASRQERDAGLEDMPLQEKWAGHANQITGSGTLAKPIMMRNTHPTVKPLALMTYLCKLVKMPEYNLILDPFCGSGSTLLACKKLGIPCIGIDSNEEYCGIGSKRCSQSVMRLGS